METYLITEKQDLNSKREGDKIQALNLTQAKLQATKNQMFQNTILVIERDGVELAYNTNEGIWKNF